MTISELFRFLKPLQDKISLLIGVAILTAVKNSEKTQKLQIQIFDETYDDMPRMQEYGFETYPDTGDTNNECLVLSISGNKNTGLIACVHNRELRPKNLQVGETQMYSKFGQRIYLKADSSVLIDAGTNPVQITGSNITLSGEVNLKDIGGLAVMVESMIAKYNEHKHPAPNLIPDLQLVVGVDSAANVKAAIG